MWDYYKTEGWIKVLNIYMNKIRISNTNQLRYITREEIEKRVCDYDEMVWLEELREKSLLELYRQYKHVITEEELYDNTYKSVLIYRARTNTLKLNWRNRFTGGDESCELCRSGAEENLQHFIKECCALTSVRGQSEVEEISLSKLLLFEENDINTEKYKEFIYCLWNQRKKIAGRA